MAIRLGDIVPDFSAKSTIGDINFHEYLGNSWGILFSPITKTLPLSQIFLASSPHHPGIIPACC